MFKDIISNEEVKKFLINELKAHKKQGTYLFYGEDRELLMDFAIAFAKSLTCKELEYDFCDSCDSCNRMESRTHGDLEIYEDNDEKNNGIKIDAAKEIVYKSSTSSYEGGNRIFILRDIERMKSEAINALLKTLEEPKEGDFFILLSNNLKNILPTIKSRSIILKIKLKTAQELNVSEDEYNFFLGNGQDILSYKESGIDLNIPKPYKEIGTFIQGYKKNNNIEDKIHIYKALRDFYLNKNFIPVIEKVKFSEEIYYNSMKDKVIINFICNYICHLVKDFEKLEKLISLKKMLNSSVNLKLFLNIFINTV